MTPEEHLKALNALCDKLEPLLDELIKWGGPGDDERDIACKLFDAIRDPEEAKWVE